MVPAQLRLDLLELQKLWGLERPCLSDWLRSLAREQFRHAAGGLYLEGRLKRLSAGLGTRSCGGGSGGLGGGAGGGAEHKDEDRMR